MTAQTEILYDENAEHWARQEPMLLSDFTARPRVLELLTDLSGARVLDLGCGEGYVARELRRRGAARVHGFDISAEMVALATAATAPEARDALLFETADLSLPLGIPDGSFNHAVAVFLFNYLTREETAAVLKTVRRAVVEGGRFVFTVPHPALGWIRPNTHPFFVDARGASYQEAVDTTLAGRIWRRDGVNVPIRSIHKTFSDYFWLLRHSGFEALPVVEELYVTEAHLELDPAFFGPLRGTPLHVLFAVDVPA
jgi:SAM-dependent methyltransferase